MASVRLYVFDGGLLTASAVTQGSIVGVTSKRIFISAALTNTTAAPILATIHLVPSGGTAGVANAIIYQRPIAIGETYPCPELINEGLNAEGFIQALGNGLTFKYAAQDLVGY